MSFRIWYEQKIINELSEKMNGENSNISLRRTSDRFIDAISPDFGTILTFQSDWNLNSKKHDNGVESPEDTQGWRVDLSNELKGENQDLARLDRIKSTIGNKLPQLAEAIGIAIGRFIFSKHPGQLDFSNLFSSFETVQSNWSIQKSMTPRFKIMAQKAIQLSVNYANKQLGDPEKEYSMLGSSVVRKDANTHNVLNKQNYPNNMLGQMKNHATSMDQSQNQRQTDRQTVIDKHNQANYLFNMGKRQRTDPNTIEPQQINTPSEVEPKPTPPQNQQSSWRNWFQRKNQSQETI